MAEEKERLNIRLHVYDTDIPVKVDREDEYFYMAMIDIALRYEKEKGHNDTSEYDNILSSLTKEIERIL